MQEEFLIQTGELKSVKTGYVSTVEIVYSGMPNETTFALTTSYSNSLSSIIYYPKESTFITVIKARFKIVEVTPDYIVLALEQSIKEIQKNPSIRSR